MGKTRLRLSPHFAIEEFDCRDGTKVPKAAEAAVREVCVHMLEPLRKKYGPCKVMSGYRNRSYNASIGGARFSQHIYDDAPASVAVDVIFARGNPRAWARSLKWRRLAKSVWRRGARGGVGLYGTFVHFDSGARRDWTG